MVSERQRARDVAVTTSVASIRAIAARAALDDALPAIKAELIDLAAQEDLFPVTDFPPPEPGGPRNSCLYRLSEDTDHRFALYANSAIGIYASPVHNHTTWAVIVGLRGEELNRRYRHTGDGGVEQTGATIVQRGAGVEFGPEDLHSIHIDASEQLLNLDRKSVV